MLWAILSFFGTFVIALIFHGITGAVVKAPGDILQVKFASLGTLTDYNYEQIKTKCGTPSSVSSTVDKDGNKVTIRQWMATGYHIVLLFDENDKCLGISSETKV